MNGEVVFAGCGLLDVSTYASASAPTTDAADSWSVGTACEYVSSPAEVREWLQGEACPGARADAGSGHRSPRASGGRVLGSTRSYSGSTNALLGIEPDGSVVAVAEPRQDAVASRAGAGDHDREPAGGNRGSDLGCDVLC